MDENDPARQREAERRRAAEELAERRGAEAADVRARLAAHDSHLDAINGSIERTGARLETLREEVGRVAVAFETATKVAEARAVDFKRATENQVSTRTFLISLIGVTLMLAALILGATR